MKEDHLGQEIECAPTTERQNLYSPSNDKFCYGRFPYSHHQRFSTQLHIGYIQAGGIMVVTPAENAIYVLLPERTFGKNEPAAATTSDRRNRPSAYHR